MVSLVNEFEMEPGAAASSHSCFESSKNDSVAESNSELTNLSRLYRCVGMAFEPRLIDDLEPLDGLALKFSAMDWALAMGVSSCENAVTLPYSCAEEILCRVGCLDSGRMKLLVLETGFDSWCSDRPSMDANDLDLDRFTLWQWEHTL